MAAERDRPVVEDGDEDVTNVKIKGKALKLLKTIASWKGVFLTDYLTELVLRACKEDLENVLAEIKEDLKAR